MDNVINVTPMPLAWTQSKQTKLGLATVVIKPEGDLVEAVVTITYEDAIFKAEGIFSSVREAFLWAYGVKQTRNDRYAGYTSKENKLIETHPSKGKLADMLSKAEALIESQSDYDNFTLSKSTSTLDKISMSAVKASTLLSDDDKAIMAALFAKMGKVTQ